MGEKRKTAALKKGEKRHKEKEEKEKEKNHCWGSFFGQEKMGKLTPKPEEKRGGK